MHRFFVRSEDVSGNIVRLSEKEQLHHARDVLRLSAGEKVGICDSAGNEYLCAFKEADMQTAQFEIVERKVAVKKSGLNLTLACAIPKNVKMDDIVDKLTQLGVGVIVPLLTERVIVKLDAAKSRSRLERWRKIALSASRQSQRRDIAKVSEVSKFKDFLVKSAADFDAIFIPALIGERRSLKEALNSVLPSKAGKILVLIGPEGDFTPEEIELAVKKGAVPVTLGDLTLRVDTAAVAVAAFLKLESS